MANERTPGSPGSPQEPTPAERAGLAEDAPTEVLHAASGKHVEGDGEKTALDYLLGRTHRPEYDLTVELETPAGMQPLTFRLRALDARTIEQIDERNRKGGMGSLARLDTATYNPELVLEATRYVTDPSGRQVDPRSEDFRGQVPSAALALDGRFRYQPGLLDGMVSEIQRISGYSATRVGQAKRVQAAAVGGS